MARFNVSFSITSPLVAIRRNKWETAAHVSVDQQFTQSSYPGDKRFDMPFASVEADGLPVLRTVCYHEANGGIASRPYDKVYADEQFLTDEILGITPDAEDAAMEWSFAFQELRGEE